MEGKTSKEEDGFLAEVFNQCDRDGSGYITRDELAALCRSYDHHPEEGNMSPGRLDALMASLDVDNDGYISFDEFKAGFQAYSSSDQVASSGNHVTNSCSTPKHVLANEEIYESVVESEFSWNEAAEKLDPDGVLEGMGVEKVWRDLASRDVGMLEAFESFLSEVVVQIQHNQDDKQKLQNHIKKIVAQHSREVSEMEDILQEQVLRIQEDTQQKNATKTKRLSSQYSSLLAEREALIEKLEEKETSLQETLNDRAKRESHLKQEKSELLSANEELRQQLSSPVVQRSTPQQPRQRLIQEWVEPSPDDQVKYYPPVKTSTRVSESAESLPSSVLDGDVESTDRSSAERPCPLGEDVSLTMSVPAETSSTAPPPNSTLVDRVFKVAFLGDSGVGKSSLILRLCEGRFNASCVSTLGLDFSTKMLKVGDERVVFQLWDTAGQERFRNALTPVYFRRSDAFVIVYDVTNKASFKSSKSWLSIVSAALREQPPAVMLVGNKTDQQAERVVSSEDGRRLALELHALFSEMSALSGDNVLQAHTTLAQLLLTRENEHLEKLKNKALELTSTETKKKCSC